MLGHYINLTDREKDVLQLIPSGMTSKEMAQVLGVVEKTVEYHLSNLYSKTDTHNKVQLLRYAMQNNLLNDS